MVLHERTPPGPTRRLSDLAPHVAFEFASILISLAILPVCLTRSAAPTFAEAASLPLRRLFAASPLGVVGAGITGLLLGAFYGLAAIYARRRGLSPAQTATFLTAVILVGEALHWPPGRRSARSARPPPIFGGSPP